MPKRANRLKLDSSFGSKTAMPPITPKPPAPATPRFLGSNEKYLPLDHFAAIDSCTMDELIEKGKEKGGGVCRGKTMYQYIDGRME